MRKNLDRAGFLRLTRLSIKLNAAWRYGIAADFPFGAGREELKVAAGKDGPDGVDLITQDGYVNTFIVQACSQIKIVPVPSLGKP